MSGYDLSGYDGVLAYGAAIRDIYLSRGWARDAWVWHEAADVRVFRPLNDKEPWGDVVFIGNWGDEGRLAGIMEFLVEPVKALGLKARVYGVGYPEEAIEGVFEGRDRIWRLASELRGAAGVITL